MPNPVTAIRILFQRVALISKTATTTKKKQKRKTDSENVSNFMS